MKRLKKVVCWLICIVVLFSIMPALGNQSFAAETWLWPAADCLIISSNFGWRSWTDDYGYHEGNHGGIDIIGANGTAGKPVRATKSGEIYDGCNTIADNTYIAGSCGNYTCIDHGDGTFSIYMHMKPGNKVSGTVAQGETIGYIGNTGESGGYHLHFELYTEKWNRQGSRLNPMPTNPEITIYNSYVLPSGWPSEKKTYVFDITPSNASVSTDKPIYTLGETVTITPSASGADHFTMRVCYGTYGSDTTVFSDFNGFVGNKTYTPNRIGHYIVRISAIGGSGDFIDAECT